jgi:hypothetical protein
MKFLADENFPRVAIGRQRQAGFDLAAIADISPGLAGNEVLAAASAEGRTLLTFDEDFGSWLSVAARRLREAYPVQNWDAQPSGSADAAMKAVQLDAAWGGHFCVADDRKIRIVPAPPVPSGPAP